MTRFLLLRVARVAVAISAVFLVPAGAGVAAGALNIQPTRLQLNGNARYTSFTLTNPGDAALILQVEPHSWIEKGNKDVYGPTSDLVVAPPVLSIGANSSRVVRIALHDVTPGDRELAYRVVVTQVPDKAHLSGVRFIYQFNMPLFVAPVGAPFNRIGWSAALDRHKRTVAVTIQNEGNVHFRVDQLRLFGGFSANVPLGSLQDASDVLAGATRVYDVPLQAEPSGSAITVEASASGQTPVRAVVDLTP